jgi:hypothetical protein
MGPARAKPGIAGEGVGGRPARESPTLYQTLAHKAFQAACPVLCEDTPGGRNGVQALPSQVSVS